jgi:hypothetical protein
MRKWRHLRKGERDYYHVIVFFFRVTVSNRFLSMALNIAVARVDFFQVLGKLFSASFCIVTEMSHSTAFISMELRKKTIIKDG